MKQKSVIPTVGSPDHSEWLKIKYWSRLALILATVLTTVAMTRWFVQIIAADGRGPIDLLVAGLFAVLVGLIAFSFWTAVLCALSVDRRPGVLHRPREQDQPLASAGGPPPGRVAVLFPVYNEDPARVFAGVEAAVGELTATGEGERFDVFVLSDTRPTEAWLREERCWQLTAERTASGPVRVYYRRRKKNTARKSGNLEEWVKRWGGAYEQMIVFDADSMMDGSTMLKMVRRMDRDPQLGILQSPPKPVNRSSLWARVQQFSASVYGPVCAMGFRLWADDDGNYWGHNAVIRVKAFAEHCGLPVLPGKAPLGGQILSHDFVEAALMKQAGYKVRLDADLTGSYEECPTTLVDYAVRDQRWCQGNLQHLGLIARKGLHPISRVHLFFGVMSFVSSPLWGGFLVLSLIAVVVHAAIREATGGAGAGAEAAVIYQTPHAIGLFAVTMGMLFFPKLVGYWDAANHQAHKHGGLGALTLSVLLETAVSVIVSPIMMAFHSRFVVNTLRGTSVSWNAQNRSESGTGWKDAVETHGWQTLIGVVAMVVLGAISPTMFWWMSPVTVGLALSIPVSMLVSSAGVGRWVRRRRLLLIHEELDPPPVVQTVGRLEAVYRQWLDEDPVVNETGSHAAALLHGPVDRLARHLRMLTADRVYAQRALDDQAFDEEPRVGPAQEAAVLAHGLDVLGGPQIQQVVQRPGLLRRLRQGLKSRTDPWSIKAHPGGCLSGPRLAAVTAR